MKIDEKRFGIITKTSIRKRKGRLKDREREKERKRYI